MANLPDHIHRLEPPPLRIGRRVTPFTVQELPDAEKPPVIRAYLRRWAWEVGRFFEGVTASSPDSQLLRLAPGFPRFRVTASR